jgi:hypothetical protein
MAHGVDPLVEIGGQYTPYLIHHLMEDIALDYAQTPLRDMMHDHPTWTLAFSPLTLGY